MTGRPAMRTPAARTAGDAPADGANLLVGGFGPLAGETSPGIEWLHLTRVPHDGGSPSHAGGAPDAGVDPDDGDGVAVSPRFVLFDVPSPTWLASRDDLVLAVLENTGELASFRWEPEGDGRHMYGPFHIDGPSMKLLSRVPVPGSGPTHAAACLDDRGEGRVVVADYGDGTIAVHPLDAAGRLGIALQTLRPDPKDGHGPLPAQDGPHAHWALPLPDGRLLTTDLGTDRIHVHRWHAGRLVRIGSVVLAPGTGPRDMHVLPMSGGGWRVAVVGEWGNDVTVLEPYDPRPGRGASACEADGEDPDGGMRVVQRIALGGVEGDQAASLAFVPGVLATDASGPDADAPDEDGFAPGGDGGADAAVGDGPDDHGGWGEAAFGMVYVGLRGSDRIVVLRWRDGALSMPRRGVSVPSGGGRPRHILALDRLLVVSNETSSRVAFFRVGADGVPMPVGGTLVGSPTVALPMRR
ncbi:beta-propeller fold lactonase family protein [uncultured Bifidobacterium sp.]|uniref:lactonase family protein n=1 Tax=uncultured Bifidobacterium sp. TaxID=165187 RepID=UPI0028DB682D|nr:beta-propeller fold lactonase family protein [uncultured Bifidobacterium sp.]